MSTELDAVITERDRLREENALLVEMLAWCQRLLGKAGEPPQQMVCDGCGVFGPTCPTAILARIMAHKHGWGAAKDGSDFCPDCRVKPPAETSRPS